MNDEVVRELLRRLSNLIRVGHVSELDASKAMVRVTFGAIKTDWLRWLTTRAGGDKTWWAPEVGEQVVVLSPGGDLGQGWVLPAGYSDASAPPGDRETLHRTVYKDGTVIEYDRAAHRLLANVQGSAEIQCTGTAKIQASGAVTIKGSSITLDGPVSATATISASGNITSDADVKAGTVSLKTHKHTGIQTGSGVSGPPQV